MQSSRENALRNLCVAMTHLCWSNRRRRPVWRQRRARCSPRGCPVSRPAAGPCSAGTLAPCGASPQSVSAGPVKPCEKWVHEGSEITLNSCERMEEFKSWGHELTISSSLMIILLMMLWTVGISNSNISESVSMLKNGHWNGRRLRVCRVHTQVPMLSRKCCLLHLIES